MATEYPGIVDHLRDVQGKDWIFGDCDKDIHDVGSRRKVDASE